MPLRFAQTDADIQSAFPVMVQLRPHLIEAKFVERIRHLEQAGYKLLLLEDGSEDTSKVRAVAGFCIRESLAWDKPLYLDDLVTDEPDRSGGYGQQLFDWLVDFAKENGCKQFHLDSGVQRFGAHRFYLKNRMIIASHHFSFDL